MCDNDIDESCKIQERNGTITEILIIGLELNYYLTSTMNEAKFNSSEYMMCSRLRKGMDKYGLMQHIADISWTINKYFFKNEHINKNGSRVRKKTKKLTHQALASQSQILVPYILRH